MATFIQLCRDTANESGTVPGDGRPTTVTGQTGRLADVVRWVQAAWRDIQNEHAGWRWMIDDFQGDTLVGIDAYAGADLGATRHAKWLYAPVSGGDSDVTLWLKSDGQADELPLAWMNWEDFRRVHLRGAVAANRPGWVSVDDAGRLRIAPKPDSVYVVRGRYRKAPQELAADDDVPEMPERFHSLIVDRALDYLGVHDESIYQIPGWSARAMVKLDQLQREELQPLRFPGALA